MARARARALITVHDLGPVQIATLGGRSIRVDDRADAPKAIDDIVNAIAQAIEDASETRAATAAAAFENAQRTLAEQAAAIEAADVRWVRAASAAESTSARYMIATGLGVNATHAEAIFVIAAPYDAADEDITTAIRAARADRGQS